jgi:hypothetical protein
MDKEDLVKLRNWIRDKDCKEYINFFLQFSQNYLIKVSHKK